MPETKFSWEDLTSLLAGRLASESSELVEKVTAFITGELVAQGLEIKPILLIGGTISGEGQALIENSIRKLFQGVEPSDIALEILAQIFALQLPYNPQYNIDDDKEE